MKLSGSTEVHGTPEEVFARLLDPEVVARCIPGCEHLREVAPGVYETEVSAGVGLLKGRFEGRVTISDVVRPTSYHLTLAGKSPVGKVNASADIRLAPTSGTTRVSYDGEAKLSGLMAAFGSPKLEGAASKVVERFFERLVAEADR